MQPSKHQLKLAFIHFYTFRLLRGIETLVLSLANELVKQGIDVSIFAAHRTLDPLVKPASQLHRHEFRLPRYFEHFFIALQIAWRLITTRYDYAIIFFADFGESLAWRLAKPFIGKRTKLIVYLCYPYSATSHRYESLKRSGLFRDAALVLADAHYIANDAADFVKGATGLPIQVVSVGTDPQRFTFNTDSRREIRAKYGYADDHFVMLNVSALEVRKGPRRVIEVLPELVKANPQIQYLILGKGDDESTLRQMVVERGLEKSVTFAGTTTDLPAYYSAADLFIMLPESEGNSVASHEALACQLPVVASRSGGFIETMRPEYSRLVDHENQNEIVAAVLELANDPALRSAMGKAGRAHIEANLTWHSSAETLLTLIASLEQVRK
jgi:glycosyltransferase involved in cell wall biosynthesis